MRWLSRDDVFVRTAPGFIEPCLPTPSQRVPIGPGWVYEIKHDGYRLIVRREGDSVRLFTRRGYDWSNRYPAFARAAAKLRYPSSGGTRSWVWVAGRLRLLRW